MLDEDCLKSENEFNNCIKLIFDFMLSYGLTTFGGIPNIHCDADRRLFVVRVHEGFNLAQEKIIETLLFLERKVSEIQGHIKESRRAGDNNAKKLLSKKSKLEYYIKVTKKCADSIAWQMIGQQHYIARRFYIGEPNMPLSSTNLKMGAEFVKKYNNDNPVEFALLSDLTTFIQIGDVLIVDGITKKLKSIELKEGKVNHEIMDFIDFYKKSKCDYALHSFIEEKGQKYLQQMQRILKQSNRALATANILNTGEGIDPSDGINIKISEDYYELKYFDDIVCELLKKLNNKDWSINIVEDCLFIGAYKGNFPSHKVFNMWMKSVGFSGPIVDFKSTFYMPIAVPPFLLHLDEKTIMDIVFGRKTLILGLNINAWFRLSRSMGFKMDYYSRKQTAKMFNKKSQFNPYIHTGKAIKCSFKGKELAMGDGLIARILFDLVLPSSACSIIKESLKIE